MPQYTEKSSKITSVSLYRFKPTEVPMNSNISQNFKRAHTQAWSAVVEDESLPEVKATVLIQFLFDLFSTDKGKRSDVIEKYIKEYGPVFKTYGKILGQEFLEKTLTDFLENSDREEFKAMAENGVARCLVKSSEKVFSIFAAYFKKEISDEEFLIRMSQTGIGEVGVKIMDAFGIDPSNLSTDPSTLLKLSGPFLAYQGAMGAYREYRKAMDDLQLAVVGLPGARIDLDLRVVHGAGGHQGLPGVADPLFGLVQPALHHGCRSVDPGLGRPDGLPDLRRLHGHRSRRPVS